MVRLPFPIKADRANAEFRDGILTITLSKTEEAKERRIPIHAGHAGNQAQDVPIEASDQSRESARQREKEERR